MLRLEFLMVIVTLAVSGESWAQSRTWAFSKDTVYENQSGIDTMTTNGQNYFFYYSNKVTITNQGAIPLVFDSLYIERIGASYSGMRFEFKTYDSTKNGELTSTLAGRTYYWGSGSCPSVGNCTTSPMNGFSSIEIQASRNLYDFSIDVPPSVAKRAATSVVGDTLCYRMIFTATNSRGRDTLIVQGTQEYPNPSSVLSGISNAEMLGLKSRIFDLRGRRMERMPDGVKVPWAPLVYPKD